MNWFKHVKNNGMKTANQQQLGAWIIITYHQRWLGEHAKSPPALRLSRVTLASPNKTWLGRESDGGI